MEDLISPQIRDSCRLALPEGLQDLMSDISREVLRAQPKNLLQFITNYLGALLVTRENLTAAAAVCDDVCDKMCAAGLEDELRYRGIDEDHVKDIKDIVDEHLTMTGSGIAVKEADLIAKIMRKTSVAADKIFDIKDAVRTAFLRQQAYNTTIFELTPDGSMDSIARATQHTLDLYRKTKPSDEEYNRAAKKIEAAYRAYGVRRQKITEKSKAVDWNYAPEIIKGVESEYSNETDDSADVDKCKRITFHPHSYDADSEETHYGDTRSVATNASEKTEDIDAQYVYQNKMVTVSSTSLAGSFMTLPKDKPYNPYDEPISEVEEDKIEEDEKQKEEHFNVDYTRETSLTVNDPIAIYTADQSEEHYNSDYTEETNVTDPIAAFNADYDPDDDTNSSVDEEIENLRKVTIDSNVKLLPHSDNDGHDGEGDEIDEEIDQLAEVIDK
ncbi:hypothetical protein NE865_04094 [Phthorimaea operculella]|nr:hypothetical protein NE865_04094 [Phthorimaea operculella]